MPKTSTKLANPDGTDEILRSEAMKRYRVRTVDLDTLHHVRTERGDKNALVKYYNTGDVEALEQQLKQDPSPKKKTAKKKGEKSLAVTELEDSVQASTSTPSLPGTSKGKMKEDSNEAPGRVKKNGKSPAKQKSKDDNVDSEKAPSSSKPRKSRVKRSYDYDDYYDDDILEEGMFDGMASDDAAAMLARLLR
ncbi:hypothetical protein F5146DRAFT_1075499 [Armillaria mellea]|nr:hypothetical protein F5146DRAFT_1075499 [Armillaria mellea]